MRLSICVTQYNNETFLPNLLNSINDNELNFEDEIELIIVDDCSVNECEIINIINKFKQTKTNKNIFNIKYIRHSFNKGTLLARKTGILQCTGDYILCMDGDDELLPNSLKTVVKELKEYNPDIYEGRCKETFILDTVVMNSGIQKYIDVITNIKNEMESHIDKYPVKSGFYQSSTGLLSLEFCIKNIIVWSKFVKHDVYIKAFNILEDFLHANMCEDVYMVFGLLLNSKTYFGSNNYFYKYNGNLNGICFNYIKSTVMMDLFKIKHNHKIDQNIFYMYKSICKILIENDIKNKDHIAFLNVRKHILSRLINRDRLNCAISYSNYYPNAYGKTLWDMVMLYMNTNPVYEYLKPNCIVDDFGYLDLKSSPINYYEYINDK